MAINLNDISDMLFKHIEKKHLYPIEKLKLLIEKRKQIVAENELVKNAKIQKVIEYMNTKAINDEAYNQFVLERTELVKRWKEHKSKELLGHVAKMRYIPPDTPHIFGNTLYAKPSNNFENIERPHKKSRNNKDKITKVANPKQNSKEPWFSKSTKVADKTFENDVKFWDKKKSLVVKYSNYYQPYDLEDVRAVEDTLLTSATINIFLSSILQSSKESSKYVVLPSEFYYQIKDIIDDVDEIHTLMNSELFSTLGDDWMNKIIIIPTNLDNIHWIISIINPYDGKIYVIDPYDRKQETVYDTISKWRSVFLEKYPNVSNKTFEPVYTIPNIPTQNKNNVDNCGVYISMYGMYFINTGYFPSIQHFDEENIPVIRKYMLHIVTEYCKENEVKSQKECPPGKILNDKNRCVKNKKV
jgi:hypothetical protein